MHRWMIVFILSLRAVSAAAGPLVGEYMELERQARLPHGLFKPCFESQVSRHLEVKADEKTISNVIQASLGKRIDAFEISSADLVFKCEKDGSLQDGNLNASFVFAVGKARCKGNYTFVMNHRYVKTTARGKAGPMEEVVVVQQGGVIANCLEPGRSKSALFEYYPVSIQPYASIGKKAAPPLVYAVRKDGSVWKLGEVETPTGAQYQLETGRPAAH